MRSSRLVLVLSWLSLSVGCGVDDGALEPVNPTDQLGNSGATSGGGAQSQAGQPSAGESSGAGMASAGGPSAGGGSGAGSLGGASTSEFGAGGMPNAGMPSAGTTTGGAGMGQAGTGGTSVGEAGAGAGSPTGGTSTAVAGAGGTPGGGGVATGGGGMGGTSTAGVGEGVAGGGSIELDCDAAMPTSGAEQHMGNGVGGSGNLAWEIWSNTGEGDLTTYDVPAFTGSWNEAGGYLGRLGYEWGGFGDTPVHYEEHGTIAAQFVSNKTGTAGQYSYVGMYGWSSDPCVEWYVVDDSFNNMPINPGTTTNMGEVEIDDGTYIMYTRPTSGSGGTRCSGVTEWIQYYSVRKTARRCGQISLTEHFDAWKGLGMELGDLLEAKLIVEVGGGVGRVDFPVANVTVTQ